MSADNMLRAASLSGLPGIRHAFFTRGGGVSGGLYASLNGGVGSRDDADKVAENRARQLGWIDRYIALGIPLEQAYVVTSFGCNLGGPVPVSAITDIVRWLADVCADRRIPFPAFYLADTMGWANPEEIKRRVGAVREIVPQARIGLHLHDTRGLGGANVYAALQMGVELFDSSVSAVSTVEYASVLVMSCTHCRSMAPAIGGRVGT